MTLTLDSVTTDRKERANVTDVPVGLSTTGKLVATGLNMSGGTGSLASFIAWCLDIDNPIRLNRDYDYVTTASPFSNSFLAVGAVDRVQSVFDANYSSVDTSNAVSAAAFQLALWDAAYDSGFDLTAGDFKAEGSGSDKVAINAAAAGYLSAASSYLGDELWDLTFLESTSSPQSQNLVTATLIPPPVIPPVPVPASVVLMIGALGGLGGLRMRRKS